MNKYKVCVYAICKNESKYVDRWVKSMSEADEIYVLDTGSTDDTVSKLKDLGVNVVVNEVKPWRFDVARNYSLELVPIDTDICVCTDLDEVFHEGWRSIMEEFWSKGTTRLRYRYTWSFLDDGKEGSVFWINKVHSRNDYYWVHPVHEVLECKLEYENEIEALGVQLDHYPDNSKSRGQYLPLLEMAVLEKPEDDRNVHYLGREYMYYEMWDKCEETLKRHLTLKNAVWKDERCASMRYISRAVINQGRKEEGYSWILKAIAEAPYLREPWIDAAQMELDNNHFSGALYFAQRALEIKERSKTYINDVNSWGYKPYDICAVACYYLELYEKAFEYGKVALTYEPNNVRLIDNMKFYSEKIK